MAAIRYREWAALRRFDAARHVRGFGRRRRGLDAPRARGKTSRVVAGFDETVDSGRSAHLEPLQPSLVTPLAQDAEVLHRSPAVEAVLPVELRGLALVVVVPGRALLEKLAAEAREADDRVDPFALCLLARLDAANVV